MKLGKPTTPTLMFHGIHSRYIAEPSYTERERFYAIREDHAIEIFGRIADDGWGVTTFASEIDASAKTVCLTFDDAHLSHYVSALPILIDFNMNAIFFITVGEVGQRGKLSWSQVKALSDSGMSIQSHSVSHRPLDRLDDAALTRELIDSKMILEDATGREVSMLSLPGGRGDARVLRQANAAGYRRVLGSGRGRTYASAPLPELGRYAVKSTAPLAGCLRYLNATPLSRAQERIQSVATAAAKDLLGENLYESLKRISSRPVARPTVSNSS